MRITVSVDIAAPPQRVWAEVSDLASHVAWMTDADRIDLEPDAPPGVGTVMRVATSVGPLRLEDIMEVVDWDEGHAIGVAHRGLVTGHGQFQLAESPAGTRLLWTEQLRFPLRLGGAITGLLARPVLAWIWRHNLRRLKDRVETATR